MSTSIRQTEVDGVRTVLAHRPGPVTAGLLFRVGSADETLVTRGITHLVEHLALHRHGVGDLQHYNGTTGRTYTHFHVQGDTEEVVSYLNGVCAALHDLPLERLDTEKEILRTEAAHRADGSARDMPLWRYGAQGYGLSSYQELGLFGIDAAAVREWAATRFTRENAVLWITSDAVPEGLTLTLPSGPAHPLPAPTSALPSTPAFFQGEDGVVVMDAVVGRSIAAGLFSDLLGKALFRDLRQIGGYSYTAECDYTPRDADFATITALADALPEKQDAVVGGFIDVLAALRAGRVDPGDLAAVKSARLKLFELPDLAAAQLPSYAVGLLTGRPIEDDETLVAEIRAVTAEDIQALAREVWDGALLCVPGTRGVDWAGIEPAPTASAELLDGRRHPHRTHPGTDVVLGEEGVSLSAPGTRVSIRYDRCAALLRTGDGGRRLIGEDGMTIALEPTLYRLTADDLAAVDAAVPHERHVEMPARPDDRIPRPVRPEKARWTRTWKGQWKELWRGPGSGLSGGSKICVLGLVALLWSMVAAIYTSVQLDPTQVATPDAGKIVFAWALTAALLVQAARIAVQRFRRNPRG